MHFSRGRRLAATGKLDEALNELQIANELNPTNGDLQAELRRTRTAARNKIAVSADGKTQLESLVERTRDEEPEGLSLPKDVKLPPSFVFREASSRDIIVTLARYGNLNVVFDPAFREAPVTTELRNVSLEDALTSITSSTRTFYKVTAPRTITIVPDTPAKRREYEDEIVRTFFLSNADLKETIDLLRIVVDLRRIAGLPATNAITIKDSPDRVAAASRILAAIDKARPEVVIDVELLEIDRKRMRDLGLQIASPGTPPTGIDGSADVNKQGLTLDDLRHLTAADVFITGVPGLYYRLIKTDQTTRTLANPQLRTAEGIAAQARFGERVPVPVTTFSPIATGGVPQQPVTSFNYENIGVNIDITPRMHHNDDVSLALKVEVSAVSGVGFGGLPDFRESVHQHRHPIERWRDEHAGRAHPRRRAEHPRRRARPDRPADRRADCSAAIGRKRNRPTSSSRSRHTSSACWTCTRATCGHSDSVARERRASAWCRRFRCRNRRWIKHPDSSRHSLSPNRSRKVQGRSPRSCRRLPRHRRNSSSRRRRRRKVRRHLTRTDGPTEVGPTAA